MTRLLTIFLVFICSSIFSQEKDSIDKFIHRTTILSTIIPELSPSLESKSIVLINKIEKN